jgi:hypothetical protein
VPRTRGPIARSWVRFIADPASGRNAIVAIVSVTLVLVVLAATALWLLDPVEYPDLFAGIWLAIQTITTVGYGDVAPTDANGRAVAGAVMVLGAATISVVTALITSIFVEARQSLRSAERDRATAEHWDRLEASLAELHLRLERIEAGIARPVDADPRVEARPD